MFLNTLMKTMRQTSFDGEEDSNALDTYQGMFDQQLVQQLAGSGQGTGLAAALENNWPRRQVDMGEDAARTGINGQARDMSSMVQTMPPPSWGKQVGTQRSTLETALAKLSEPRVKMEAPAASSASSAPATGGPAEFTKTLLPHAQQAAQELGVAPHLVVAHAALESGWGKKPFAMPTAATVTTCSASKPVVAGKARPWTFSPRNTSMARAAKQVERFRAYDNYQDAFADYARLIRTTHATKVRSAKAPTPLALPVAWRVVVMPPIRITPPSCRNWPANRPVDWTAQIKLTGFWSIATRYKGIHHVEYF